MEPEASAAAQVAAGNEAMLEAAFRTGDFAAAEAQLTEARRRAEKDGDRATEAAAIDRLGMLMHFRQLDGDFARADTAGEEALFQRALTIRREIGDLAGAADSLFGIGLVHQVFSDDWDTAMPYYWEALALAEQHAGPITRSEVHRHVGFYYAVADKQPDRALFHLRKSHELRAEHGDPRWIPGGTLALGEALIAAGRRDEGLAMLREAIRQARDAGLRPERMAWFERSVREAEEQQAAKQQAEHEQATEQRTEDEQATEQRAEDEQAGDQQAGDQRGEERS
jgi:tetratricopeptide (TPR) repeat protein